jgi:hypothetical protein
MKMMLKPRHPNIIKAFDRVKTRTMDFIFMQFAANGNVEELLI